ncbi:T9SS type A sorting domain-containing protein [Flavobacterium sp. 3HN19-14]|uniref:Ig-like domain-containing protein n=1 Tax=Flavobacterium sp. 3HN19-14 TaxID=3448133 RepID=UPI003EE237D3
MNTTPTITATTPATRCDAGSVTLGATASAGTINWYGVASGGSILASGASFITPSISTSTTYYVEVTNGSCTSARIAVLATVNATPTITATTPGSRCGAGVVTLSASASSGTLTWYNVATGGTVLGTGTTFLTPSISATATYYVQSANGSCASARTAVTATINDIPTITATTPASRCDAGSVTLGATASAGTLNWYALPSGGSVLGTGTSFVTGNINVTTTFYVEAVSGSCTSGRTAVIATVNTTPSIVTTTPASRCDSGPVTLTATATGGTISWYDVATGGTALTTGASFLTPSISATTTYYIEASNGSCTSARTAVTATVNATPTITGTTPASRCGAGTVTLGATTSAGTLNWYSASTGGILLGSGTSFTTVSISTTTTYYVEAVNGSCTSARVAVTATVNTIPTITATTPASRCDSGSVTLSATASTGTLSWFDVATGGTALATGTSFATPSISATTTYYVEASNGSCTSARTAVTATVNATPTITGTTPSSRCGAGTVTLGATASAGTLNWYNVATGGTILGTGTSFVTISLSATTTYYVEAVNGSCISPRIAVTATVNAVPTITATTPASRCDSGSVTLTATASSGTLSWFDVATGGTALATGTSLETPSISATTTYYVEASNGSCTSTRTAVTATVNATPTITGTTPGSRCDAGIVTLGATASSGILSWYNVATGGTVLATGTTFVTASLSATTTYYVEASNGSCTSARIAVTATVNATPAITATAPASRCDSGTLTLSATASSGTINWYGVPTGGTVLGSGSSFTTPVLSTTTMFYVESVNGSCTSVRTPVIATVNLTPTIVGTTPNSRCGAGTVVLGATATSGTLSWFNVATGGTALATGTTFTTPSISATTTYYVESSNGTCTSVRQPVIATVNTLATVLTTTPGSRCGNGSVTLSATSASGLSWYASATGGTALATGATFNTPSINATTTYYVEASNGDCTSVTRTPVIATVNHVASPTGSTSQQFCSGETVGMLVIAETDITWYDAATGGNEVAENTLLVAGTTYYASLTSGDCGSDTRLAVTVTLGTCLGTEDIVRNEIKLYPNPVRDILTIEYTANISRVEVVNMLGQVVYNKLINAGATKVDMSNLAEGTYIVRVTADDLFKTYKVIKR